MNKATRMRALTIVGLGVLVLSGLPMPGSAQIPGNLTYQLIVDCPGTESAADVNDYVCPVKAIDEQDIMGSPSIAVDPSKPNDLILASLHGFDGAEGPTDRSRAGQVFTTFISRNHGASWADNPYYPPSQDDLANAYGEHPQAAVDQFGHIYIGSLYAIPAGGYNGPGPYEFKIVAQKFKSVGEADDRQDGDYNAQYLDPVYPGNHIDQFWFLYDVSTDTMTIVWNERVPPGAAAESKPETALPQALRSASDDVASPGKARSVIGMAWTTSALKAPYYYVPEENNVGPCKASTNPVLSEGFIYMGCVVDVTNGTFPYDARAQDDQIHVFRFELVSGQPHYLGRAPFSGGTPKMGARTDGRIALFSTEPTTDGSTRLVAVYGRVRSDGLGMDWGDTKHYTTVLGDPEPGRRVIESNIQDIVYREQSGVVHIILKERFELREGLSVDDPLAAAKPGYTKRLVAIDEKFGVLAQINLDIGNLLNRTPQDSVDPTAPEDVFNDLTDDLVQLPAGNYSYEGQDLGGFYSREFFAVADYGIVIFAEIIEITDLRAPAVANPPAPAAPLAAPAAQVSLAAVLVPAGGITVVGAFASLMVLNRRKNPATALSKMK